MAWMGFDPGTAGWKVQTNPLSYGAPSEEDLVSL